MIRCIWNGDAFEPYGRTARAMCQERFGDGEILSIEAERERSMRSHRHQFAEIHEMWLNLPERLMAMPYAATSETLRKHALIVTGYRDCETIVAGSDAAAERVAAYVGQLARKAHGYAIVKTEGPTVLCYTPHSQSIKAMGSERFQESKTAILEWIEDILKGEAA